MDCFTQGDYRMRSREFQQSIRDSYLTWFRLDLKVRDRSVPIFPILHPLSILLIAETTFQKIGVNRQYFLLALLRLG